MAPLGTSAVLGPLDQNRVVSTIRGSEVVSDSTNVLALECARRRRRGRAPVRLCASQRLLRAQAYDDPQVRPDFRLLGLCAAGRDEGSWRFELQSLAEQLDFALRFLAAAGAVELRVSITELAGGRRLEALQEHVLDPLSRRFPEAGLRFDPERDRGRGYYVGACFRIEAAGVELADGGFTAWTQALLSDRKERLLICGIGIERLVAARD